MWGLILIVIGGWLFANSLGLPAPGIETFWPIFPTLVGAWLLITWLLSQNRQANHGIAIPAMINLLTGLFFFGFTMGFFEWGDMAYLWPIFPLIVGVAFLVAWTFSLFQAWGLLIPGGITSAVGLIALSLTTHYADRPWLKLIFSGWPIILILIGISILARGLLTPYRAGPPAQTMPPSVSAPDELEDFDPDADKTVKTFKHQQES